MIIIKKLNKNSKDIILEEKPNGCIECISHSRDDCGYTRIRYKEKHERLFRVLYELKYGEIPKKMVLRHKCDNPRCCNTEHLELGTQKDNVRDMIERGRDKYHLPNPNCRGTKNNMNKLSEANVEYIYKSNIGCRKLSKIFKVSPTTILLIKHKKMWKWLTDEIDKDLKKQL